MFNSFLDRLHPAPDWPAPAPGEPITVIGDIHGRADLLAKALEAARHKTVLVGDYVDRGEDSAGVLRMLFERDDLVCLRGNHEDMLLKALDDPSRYGARWLRYGGLQTLASFGVAGANETSSDTVLEQVCEAVARAMGKDLVHWLSTRPSLWQTGNVAVVHAGADPTLAMQDQSHATLRWGHRDFEKIPRRDGIWVVHGHVIVDEPTQRQGRINVDTGAYATGRLTAAHITQDDITFETFN